MAEFVAAKSGETEQQWRQFMAYLFAQASTGKATTGVLTGLGVTQTTTASASVVVGAGAGTVQAATNDGVSPVVTTSAKTLDVLTANPVGGLPRNDIIVWDSASGASAAIIGTPAATPSDPSVPTSAIPLARIRNAASATTIPAANIDDLRTYTSLFGVPDDTGWQNLTITAGYSAVAGYTLQYRRIGRMVHLRGAVAYNGGGTITTLPTGVRPSSNSWLGSGVSGTGGFDYMLLVATTGSITIPATYYNGTASAGHVLPVFGSFLLD